jgi:hypothetical protein
MTGNGLFETRRKKVSLGLQALWSRPEWSR